LPVTSSPSPNLANGEFEQRDESLAFGEREIDMEFDYAILRAGQHLRQQSGCYVSVTMEYVKLTSVQFSGMIGHPLARTTAEIDSLTSGDFCRVC
jgi:hypothetical protein